MNSKSITGTIAVLLLCALPACSTVAKKPAVQSPLQASLLEPVERVNGVAITRAELQRTVRNLLVQNRMTAQLSPEMIKQAEEVALTQLTSAELLYQEARKSEVKDLEKQVTEKLDQGKSRFASQAEFEKFLESGGLTLSALRDDLRREAVVNSFIEGRFAAKETVPEAEAKKFYDENAGKFFKKGERVKAHHILVKVAAKASPEEKKKALAKAEALLKRVQGGEDFSAVAKKESDCPTSARGGDLGVFGKGQMPASFEKVAYALKPGEISQVVESEFGYHVIRLDEKVPAATENFEQVKEKIVAYLKAEKIKKAVNAYLDELRSKAKIEKV